MTLRADMLTDAQAAWFDTDGLAQTVTYIQPAREAGTVEVVKDIPAIIAYGDQPEPSGRYQGLEMTAMISQADVALPRKDGDTITVAGVVWRVRSNPKGDALGVTWAVSCTRSEQAVMRRQV